MVYRALILYRRRRFINHLLTYLLAYRAIFNDLEVPQTQILRSGHSLTL